MQGQTGTEHVRQLLDELGARYTPTEDGKLKVEAGSTAIYMTVEEVGGHEVVCLLAPLLSDLAPTADQLAELLAFNAELNFGKFSWHPEERTLKAQTTREDELVPWLKTVVKHEAFALRRHRERHAPVTDDGELGERGTPAAATHDQAEQYERLRQWAEGAGTAQAAGDPGRCCCAPRATRTRRSARSPAGRTRRRGAAPRLAMACFCEPLVRWGGLSAPQPILACREGRPERSVTRHAT